MRCRRLNPQERAALEKLSGKIKKLDSCSELRDEEGDFDPMLPAKLDFIFQHT